MFWNIISVLVALTGLAYYFLHRRYSYWKNQNVPYSKPMPIVGNYGGLIFLQKHIAHIVVDICKEFPNEPYIGAFFGTDPTLIVQDPQVIKQITTKDFYYYNGREISDYTEKEVIGRNVLSAHGDNWKVVRQNLTPIFSSAKMKMMFDLVNKCALQFEKLLDHETKMSDIVEARLIMARYTMACITSCAFGVDGKTMEDGFLQNPFKGLGDLAFNQTKFEAFKLIIRTVWPGIFYGFGQKIVPIKFNQFFHELITSVFKARGYKPSDRNDFIDFILSFQENKHITGDSISNLITGEKNKASVPVNDEFLVAQCFIFFLAGFETSATTLSYTVYEFAKNPDVMRRAQKEVDEYLLKRENKLQYDSVNELPFLDACVDETLRMYPVTPVLTREVLADTALPSGVKLHKGVRIHIPLQRLHYHPKYFPEPEVYRPERFLGEEKRNIVPNTYMPFGDGPRLCLGQRFAKMQILSGLVTVLKKFDFELAPGTPTKPRYVPYTQFPIPSHPLNVKFTPREGWQSRIYNKN
ncbi:hypothetical protein ABMA27_000928 [Loxostege sticticalis]|uniref:unspecific monooxygenase n=1 Tax=Loxostege sticticalis TaxID=481309 RepID=A0ABR3I0W2_LOXSC